MEICLCTFDARQGNQEIVFLNELNFYIYLSSYWVGAFYWNMWK